MSSLAEAKAGDRGSNDLTLLRVVSGGFTCPISAFIRS
jgi:hypothetical protein